MSLLCGGPAYAFPADRLRRLVAPQLLRTAKAIEHEIGGGDSGHASTEPPASHTTAGLASRESSARARRPADLLVRRWERRAIPAPECAYRPA